MLEFTENDGWRFIMILSGCFSLPDWRCCNLFENGMICTSHDHMVCLYGGEDCSYPITAHLYYILIFQEAIQITLRILRQHRGAMGVDLRISGRLFIKYTVFSDFTNLPVKKSGANVAFGGWTVCWIFLHSPFLLRPRDLPVKRALLLLPNR